MKSSKLIKTEISEKIHTYDFDKSQLKLINKYIDMIAEKGENKIMTSFEDYMLSLNWVYVSPNKLGIIFEKDTCNFPITFDEHNLIRDKYFIYVDKILFEKYDITETDFKETLKKVFLLKGIDRELDNYHIF